MIEMPNPGMALLVRTTSLGPILSRMAKRCRTHRIDPAITNRLGLSVEAICTFTDSIAKSGLRVFLLGRMSLTLRAWYFPSSALLRLNNNLIRALRAN